jgi:hypothetical protein
MGYVDGHLGGMFGGVSQQPDILRHPGQCSIQNNMLIDFTEGLKRRPRAEQLFDANVQTFPSAPSIEQIFSHWFLYQGQPHVLVITPQQQSVFNLGGDQLQVTVPDALRTHYVDAGGYFDLPPYIPSGTQFNPKSLVASQVGDYVLIANRDIQVQYNEDVDATPDIEVVTFHIRDAMEWGLKYSITYDGTEVTSFTSATGETVNESTTQTVRSDYIAEQLQASLLNTFANPADKLVYLGVRSGSFATVATAFTGLPWLYLHSERKYVKVTSNTLVPAAEPDLYGGQPTIAYRLLTLENVDQVTGATTGVELTPTGPTFFIQVWAQRNNLLSASMYSTWPVSPGIAGGYRVARSGSTVSMYRTRPLSVEDGEDGYISGRWGIDDSRSGLYASTTVHEIEDIDRLPPRSFDGHVVEVVRRRTEADTGSAWFIFKCTQGNGELGDGTWLEYTAPHTPTTLEERTLPAALIPSDTGFVLTALNGETLDGIRVDLWGTRSAGNAVLNPDPVFVGKRVRDIRSFSNRLVLMTEEGVSLSRPREEFEFFSKTVQTVLDTDPLHLSAPGDRLPQLNRIAEHDQHLVLVGTDTQYVLPGRASLTPGNATIVQTTLTETTDVRPSSGGMSLFIPYKRGQHSGVSEYFSGSVQDRHQVQDSSANVSRYISREIRQLVTDRQSNILFVMPEPSPSALYGKLYLFQYLWHGEERVIQAWQEWTVPFQPLDIFVDVNNVYVLGWSVQDGSRVFRFNMDMVVDPGPQMYIHLDAHFDTVVLQDGSLDLSAWRHPLFVTDPDQLTCVVMTGQHAGMRVQIDSYEYEGTASLRQGEELAGETVRIGIPYMSEYAPTMPVVKDREGRAIQTGVLTVGTLNPQVYESGSFLAEVRSEYYPESTQQFTARSLGFASNLVGRPALESRTYTVSIRQRAREVLCIFKSEEHTPMTIQAIEWTGQYNKRGSRL